MASTRPLSDASFRPARTALNRPAAVLECHDVERPVAADRTAVRAIPGELHAEMHLLRPGVDHLHMVPRRPPPASRLALALPDQIVVVRRSLHHGDGSAMEAHMRKVEPARSDRLGIA